MQQYIGLKIQLLLKHKDLKQQALATLLGIGPQHLSKKIGEEAKFSSSQVVTAAKFLGVTPEYLKDEKRPFNEGDEIPPDALAKTAVQDVRDTDPLRLISQLIQNEAQRQVEFRMIQEEMEKMHHELKAKIERVDQKLTKLSDEADGNHDPD